MAETSRAHREKAPEKLGFALITISTSRYREFEKGKKPTDESGDLIAQMLQEKAHTLKARKLIPDDKATIKKTLQELLRSSEIEAVITCGGTGITPTDVTIEAVEPLLEKKLQGFGELFRWLSYQAIGSGAVMTRAMAGIANGKAVFCLPGSPQAAKLSLEKLILPEAGHIILHAHGK